MKTQSIRIASLAWGFACFGCSGGTPSMVVDTPADMAAPAPQLVCKVDSDCPGTPDKAQCEVRSGACLVRGYPIGMTTAMQGRAMLTVVFDEKSKREPTGLGFNSLRPNELWIVNRADDTVSIVTDVGTAQMTSRRQHDPDALHFMHRPSGIAFCQPGACKAPGMLGYFGTCGENDGSQDHELRFTGPTLFDSDPAIFAKPTPGGLGSHIDMLHDTSWCMGIAQEQDNVYWVFDGGHQSLARYDFQQPHEPGGDDHSDGIIAQYAIGQMLRVSGVPSGLVYDNSSKLLFAADTGHNRIISLDISTATDVGSLPSMEPSIPEQMDGATIKEVVPAGTLQAPSGMALDDRLLYVTDNATSRIYAFELDGRLVRSLDSGLPAGSLAGITIGPDGKAYFADMLASRVYRIDP